MKRELEVAEVWALAISAGLIAVPVVGWLLAWWWRLWLG